MRTSWVCPKLAGPGHCGRVAFRAGLGTCRAGSDRAPQPGLVRRGMPRSVQGEMKPFGPQLGLGFPPKQPPNCILYYYECFKAGQVFLSTSALAWQEQQQSGDRMGFKPASALHFAVGLLGGRHGAAAGPSPPSSCGLWTQAAPWRAPAEKAGAASCSKAALQSPNPLGTLRKGRTGDTLGWYQRAERRWWHGAGPGLPWCYGASQHCAPLSSPAHIPRAPCTPQGSQIPASSALLPHRQPRPAGSSTSCTRESHFSPMQLRPCALTRAGQPQTPSFLPHSGGDPCSPRCHWPG